MEVGAPVKRDIVVVNKGKQKLRFVFQVPQSNKFIVRVSPVEVVVKPGANAPATVSAMLFCTCRIDAPLAVVATWNDKGAKFSEHIDVRLAANGKLSTRIDFDELQFETKIGQGSYGTVWKGKWRSNVVALKLLNDAMFECSPQARDDFLREADLMNVIRCPFIVSFFGLSMTNDRLCLVSEFMPLGSLSHVLKETNLVKPLRVRIALDISSGMAFLHGSDILHRDLKPDNVLCVQLAVDAPVVCKINDFGTSRAIANKSNIALTKGLGTPLYMVCSPPLRSPAITAHTHAHISLAGA